MPDRTAATRAADHLRPYFEAVEAARRAADGRGTWQLPADGPERLAFLDPMWGARPDRVWDPRGAFVLGRVRPADQGPYGARVGIWDAASGRVALAVPGAVAMAWTPRGDQVGAWCESLEPTPGWDFHGGKVRSDWRQRFERYRWPGGALIHRLDLGCDGDLEPGVLAFPKTYRGRIAKLTSWGEGETSVRYVRCDAGTGDRVLDRDEMAAYRRGARA